MAKYIQIGNKYYTVGDRSQLQQISEQDIVGRRGTGGSLDLVRKEGDLQVIDPSQVVISPKGEVLVGGKVLSIGGSQAFVPQGTTVEQFTGLPFNQDFAQYQSSQTAKSPTLASDSNGMEGPFIRFKGSPDVFNSQTGKVVTYAEAQKVPNFFSQVKDMDTPRPEVKSGSDFANWSGKSLSLDALPQVQRSLQGSTTTGQTVSTGVSFDTPDWYKAYGISDDMWNKLDAGTKAFVQSTAQLVQGQYDQGMINVSVNSDLLNKALASAQTDPNIIAKYGDSLKLAQADVQRNLALVDEEFAQSKGLLTAKQQAERKALSEQEADAGRVYSGFRQQAEKQLATEQSAVIGSSKRALQSKLNQLGGSLEKQYGTAGLGQFGQIQAGGLAYQSVGGITGLEQGAKQSDIETRQQQIFNMEKLT